MTPEKHETQAAGKRIYIQYLGVLSLLGRVAAQADLSDMDRDPIDRAFVDANVVLRRQGSTMYFERCAGGGYAAFDDGPTKDPAP